MSGFAGSFVTSWRLGAWVVTFVALHSTRCLVLNRPFNCSKACKDSWAIELTPFQSFPFSSTWNYVCAAACGSCAVSWCSHLLPLNSCCNWCHIAHDASSGFSCSSDVRHCIENVFASRRTFCSNSETITEKSQTRKVLVLCHSSTACVLVLFTLNVIVCVRMSHV